MKEVEPEVIEVEPEVIRMNLLSMQVCVPEEFTDAEVEHFANSGNLCGTELGWCIRREGDEALQGTHERVPCADRDGYVHIILDC